MGVAQVDQLIERMDLDADGHIAFDEFSSALVDWKKVLSASLPPLSCASRLARTPYQGRINNRVREQ